MKSAITVSLVAEARGGPFVYWDDLPAACREASELGFDAVEIFPPGPEAIDATTIAPSSPERGSIWRPSEPGPDGSSIDSR